MDLRRTLLYAIHEASKLVAVINGSDVKPAAQRMQTLAIEQCLLGRARPIKRVETPAAIDHANLKEHPAAGVRAGCRILFEMKPALFGIAAVRAEDGFPRELLGAGEGMDTEQETIVHAVE